MLTKNIPTGKRVVECQSESMLCPLSFPFAFYQVIDVLKSFVLVAVVLFSTAGAFAQEPTRPKVWIYTDMSDPALPGSNHRGTVNDPDDVSAMAGYLLMADRFETLGIVVASTHRGEHAKSPDQGAWANEVFGNAYQADLPALKSISNDFPKSISFVQSCIKESADKFDPGKDYASLFNYGTVESLFSATQKLADGETINVLCWGSLTEPAILVAHCLATENESVLEKLRFIGHWTDSSLHQGSPQHPEDVANCREDAAACSYIKSMAAAGKMVYHECGAIGQHGIVSGSPKGNDYFDQFRTSSLGKLFVDGKFVNRCVDHSDSATYWVLLGEHGVTLKDIAPDGTNSSAMELENEKKFAATSQQIHDELLRRSKIAGSTPRDWETLTTTGEPTARHEATLVGFDGKVFLLGGRRINPVDVYDPATNAWTAKSTTPMELHHFQGVVMGERIYLMGAMTGPYPRETPLEKIVVYYPKDDRFDFVHSIPESRRRGGAGAVFHDGKIYLIGGITNGHVDGYQNWFDRYDPQTGDWDKMPDAPTARDHFQAVVIDERLYAAGGRQTSKATNEVFSKTIAVIDVFDFKTGQWLPESECPLLPTPRAGNSVAAIDGKLVVAGGETGNNKLAHAEVEAYDPKTDTWTTWPSLQRGRHGSGLALIGDYVYTASGSGGRGGGPELTSTERLPIHVD